MNKPNFDVLDHADETILTVLKEAPIPKRYEGTLIKLHNEDLSDLKMVSNNLNVKKLVFFEEDKEIANRLSDFPVVIQ